MLKYAAILLALTLPATAAEKGPPQKELTVGEVIGIANALATIDLRPMGIDKNGNPVNGPSDFKFTGPTRMLFARIANSGQSILKTYQESITALQKQYEQKNKAGTGLEIPTEKVRDFEEQRQKAFDSPAGIRLPHIRTADLCLEVKLPDCPVKNEIAVQTLAALAPIIEE